jgi:hypothetical protein
MLQMQPHEKPHQRLHHRHNLRTIVLCFNSFINAGGKHATALKHVPAVLYENQTNGMLLLHGDCESRHLLSKVAAFR